MLAKRIKPFGSAKNTWMKISSQARRPTRGRQLIRNGLLRKGYPSTRNIPPQRSKLSGVRASGESIHRPLPDSAPVHFLLIRPHPPFRLLVDSEYFQPACQLRSLSALTWTTSTPLVLRSGKLEKAW